jgi:hypothetical protein
VFDRILDGLFWFFLWAVVVVTLVSLGVFIWVTLVVLH